MKTIVHSTSIGALNSILKLGMILDQDMRRSLNIAQIEEGTTGRKLGHYTDPLEDTNFWKKVDEAKGVYFRLGPVNQQADVQLIFSSRLLNKYPEYIFNTGENFGFVVGQDGVEGESPFSGEPTTTYWGRVPPNSVLKNLVPDNTEILIPESVDLENLVAIKYKTPRLKDERYIPLLNDAVKEIISRG